MEKDIGKIRKNDNTDIVIRVDDFGGRTGVTIREFTTSERYTGFTKSGTRISAEKFEDFKALINSVNASDFPAASEPVAKQQALPTEDAKEDAEKPSESESESTDDY